MRYRFLISLLLIFSILAVFWPVNSFEFVSWDDGLFVYENPYINPPTVNNTLHYWTEPKWLYMPLTYSAWATLAWLSQQFPAEPYGLNPRLFHTANLIVHILSVLVVFSILRILLRHGFKETGNDRENAEPSVELAAGIGALVFALHPVQVEPVAWVSELKDLLCGLFSFIAIREYLAYAIASKTQNESGNKTAHYALACAAFLLALFSKPAAVVVPLIAFILDRWAIRRPFKASAAALVGWFIVAALFAIIAKTVQQSEVPIVTVPLWARPFIAGDALAFYIYKLVWPVELGIEYGRKPEYVMEQWWGYVTWLVPFTLLVGTLFLKRRAPVLVPLGIFAATLLPVLGFVSFIFQNQSTVADHYLYIPMLGVVLAVSWIIFNHQLKLTGSLCVLVILLFGIRSSFQVAIWKNDTTLYKNALAVNPESLLSHYNLANLLGRQGRLDEAISHYKKALKILPTYADAHNNLGVALDKHGKPDEAVAHYKKALQIKPTYANAYNNLGLVMEDKGKLDEAAAYYKKAIELQPDDANAHNNLGIVLKKQGKLNEAVTHFSKALRIKPDFRRARKQLEIAKAGLKK